MLIKKILLAEDDPDDQSLFLDFLSHRPDIFIFPVVDNGVELLSFLEVQDLENLPDLIILDQNMPKKNGLKTLEFLKSQEKYSAIPVMIYSTYTDKELIRKGEELGATCIASKPVDQDGYHQMIDDFLKRVQ